MLMHQKLKIRKALDQMFREHERDGSGNGLIRHIVEWLHAEPPDERELIRDILLDDFRAALPNEINWIALGALAVDAAPRTASELEKLARSAEGRLEWRDQIIWNLASMGHRHALDLYVEALRAGRDFRGDYCLLRAHLIKVDPELALDYGTQYFVEGFSQSQDMRHRAANCTDSFLSIYRDVDPRYVLVLARRVSAVSASAGHQLVSEMLRDCKWFLTLPPNAGDTVLLDLQRQLESLRHENEQTGTQGQPDPRRLS